MSTQTPDINSLDLYNEPVEVTGEASGEEFFSVPVPDDGDHSARLSLGDRGITIDRQRDKQTGQKTGAVYLNVHLAAQLYDDLGNAKGQLFDNPTSIKMERDGQSNSKLHAILDLAGEPARHTPTIGALKEHTEKVFAQNPDIIVVSRWEASSKAETDEEVNNAISAGYWKAPYAKVGGYYTFLKGQKKFPETDTGFDPEVVNPITGEKVRAQAKIVRYKRIV